VNYNISPKAKARATPQFIGTHHALIESPQLEKSLEVALAEYARLLALNTSEEPRALHFKLAGAHEFLITLRNLAEQPEAPRIVTTDNLSQNTQ
jgi:hypothetical protein